MLGFPIADVAGFLLLSFIYYLLVIAAIQLWDEVEQWQRRRKAARTAAIEAELDRVSDELAKAVLDLAAELDHDRDEAIRLMNEAFDTTTTFEIRR